MASWIGLSFLVLAVTSTLTVVERRAPGRAAPPVGAQEAMLPQLRDQVMAGLARADQPENRAGELLDKYMAMEKAFYDAGGFLVVGTDPTGGGDVVPGYANQRALQLLVGAVFAAYFLWCWLRGGQTLAMKAWRIRLVGVSPRRAVLRLLIAAALLPLSIAWALFDRDGQFLHDRLSGTRLERA